MEPDYTPQNAERLARLVERGASPEVVNHLKAYTRLLRGSAQRPRSVIAVAPAQPAPLRFMFKLEFPDGRWDVEERQLEAPPRVGDRVSFDDGRTWQVRDTQMVTPGRARKPPRQLFICGEAA